MKDDKDDIDVDDAWDQTIISPKIREQLLGELSFCQCQNKYSIEPHGNGYAIYWGRCMHRHGANLGHLTGCNRKDLIDYFEKALNRKADNDCNGVE